MHDFETLVGELLGGRPELSREELMRRIAEKKETVGAGYLTDQGALFLVAGELGVTLQRPTASSDMAIKDLYIGANDVTVVARILAVYPTSTYKKKDGGEGKYRRLVLFDGKSTVRLTVWEEGIGQVEKPGMGVDVPVRVVSGYVKQGLDGKPNLNLGKRGGLEVVPEAQVSAKLAKLAAVAEKLTGVSQERAFAALECVVATEPRYSEFVRSDGSPGSLFQFGVSGEGGRQDTRVVIWSPAARPELKPGQKVVITNVRSRRSTNGDFEIHGDTGSAIIPGGRKEPLLLRVAAASKGPAGVTLLAIDRSRKLRVVELTGDQAAVAKGDVVKVSPDAEQGGRLVCRSKGAVEVVGDAELPKLDELATKLRDAKEEASHILVEVIALSHGSVEDVHLKDGSAVKKGELVVGDDTAEAKVVGWRDQSDRLNGIQPGERLRISWVAPKSMKMGGWVLELNPLTVIERIRGRD
jgi:ssDNA-binding replication factor A large subunit